MTSSPRATSSSSRMWGSPPSCGRPGARRDATHARASSDDATATLSPRVRVWCVCPRPGSYVFRVANKDMTYAQQLRDYENAVIQKRFEELSEEEVDSIMGEIYPSKPDAPPKP